MKKVFAFLSTLVLTLACVGVALAPVKAADVEVAPGKFIVDPTVEENEIPMYIMDSIRTTFPNYYDNIAKPDPKWEGIAREFPWNETKLWVSQFDATGTATGKFYAPYFVGAATAATSGAGQQIYDFQNGKTGDFTATPSTGKYRTPAQTSLSYVRFNLSDDDITVKRSEEPIDVPSYIIFDGQGKAVRGLTHAAFFQTEDWTPLHCYAEDTTTNYIITPDANFTGCARNLVQDTDPESGDPIVDGEGNPVMKDNGPKLFTNRILWQYMAEEPANLNANGYLGADWKEENWDYYDATLKVAYIYTTGDANWGNLTDEEAKKNAESEGIYAANEATVEANGTIEGAVVPSKDATVADYNTQVTAYNTLALAAGKTELTKITKTAGKVRTTYGTYVVPARGMFYEYGYLDRGKPDMMKLFNQMYVQAMKFGRSESYSGTVRTYNFSSGDLKVKTSGLYTPLEGRANIFEVLPNSVFYPKNNVNVIPMATYWKVENDVTSFRSDPNALEYKATLNGVPWVFPFPYASKQAVVTDFMADFNAFLLAHGKTEVVYNETTNEIAAKFYDARYDLAGENKTTHVPFFGVEANRIKWKWLIDYLVRTRQAAGLAVSAFTPVLTDGFTASSGTFANEFKAFFLDAHYTAWPATSDYTLVENQTGYLPKASYNDFQIDTTGAPLNKNYVIALTVKNADTNKESTITFTYVITDSYTPVLTLNPSSFYKRQGETLDKNALATAKDAYGNNISQNIQYEIDWNGVVANEKQLPAGKFNVVVSITENGKTVQKTGVLQVTDTQKPVVEFQSLVRVGLGESFYFTDGIKSAIDNVDGNLFNNVTPSFSPFVMNSENIDTSKPGRYTVEFEVYDRAGNKTEGEYDVIVAANVPQNILDAVEDLQKDVSDILDKVNEPLPEATDYAPTIYTATAIVSAVVVVATAAVVLVVLKKKNQ